MQRPWNKFLGIFSFISRSFWLNDNNICHTDIYVAATFTSPCGFSSNPIRFLCEYWNASNTVDVGHIPTSTQKLMAFEGNPQCGVKVAAT